MLRRLHCDVVHAGKVALSDRQAHHVRDVLRLPDGQRVEVFDDAGAIAEGILRIEPDVVAVQITAIRPASNQAVRIVIASAVPKGSRADWLIEKLSEIGVDVFIPLSTQRAVVVPEGKNKLERWARLAAEAAKQSRRAGVMKIEPLTPLDKAIQSATVDGVAWHLSTVPGSEPIVRRLQSNKPGGTITLFVGPEGGWTPEEIERFNAAGIPGTGLTSTVLRVETAAVVAAAVVAASLLSGSTIATLALESPDP